MISKAVGAFFLLLLVGTCIISTSRSGSSPTGDVTHGDLHPATQSSAASASAITAGYAPSSANVSSAVETWRTELVQANGIMNDLLEQHELNSSQWRTEFKQAQAAFREKVAAVATSPEYPLLYDDIVVMNSARDKQIQDLETERAVEVKKLRWHTWKSADGKFSIEAMFVKATAGAISLEKHDGSAIVVPKEQLGEDDWRWITTKGWDASDLLKSPIVAVADQWTPPKPGPLDDSPSAQPVSNATTSRILDPISSSSIVTRTSDRGPKTEHVSGYTKKNGTYVAPYTRHSSK